MDYGRRTTKHEPVGLLRVAYGAGAQAQLHRVCRERRAIKTDAFANYFTIASDRSVRPAGERCLPGDSNVPVISSIVRSTCRSFGAGRRIQVQQAAGHDGLQSRKSDRSRWKALRRKQSQSRHGQGGGVFNF
jgi:hypothetical protein